LRGASEEEQDSDGSEDSDFKVNEGDDGDGGGGGTTGVAVGDLLRIWWVEDKVWFRCRVVGMGCAGRVAQVRYLVDERWGDYYHALDEVKWGSVERGRGGRSGGGEVRPRHVGGAN
jgi:hypothetical protein